MRRESIFGILLLAAAALGQHQRHPDMDLPVHPDNYKPMPQEPLPLPPPPEPPADDPADEPVPVFYGEEIQAENGTLVYVIDVSGSMSGSRKLVDAKAELRRSISQLSPSIRFNVIAYDCTMESWRPAKQPANEPNKASACAWSDALTPGGGTGTGPAMAFALSDKEVMSVVLLTDGAPSCGVPRGPGTFESHRRMIRDNNTQGATITVFGVHADGNCRTFCQNVARDGSGSYYDISR